MTGTTTAPALSHRRVLAIALPIVVSNATVPILGLVDTGVVGQLGEAAPIGAVGIGAMVLTAVYWMFGFLRMATTGLAAQALGAGDRAEYAAFLVRALLVAIAGGLAVIALQLPVFRVAFWVAPASAEVEALARDYMAIRVWSAPAAIAVYGITGWLIAAERTRAVLAVQVWMNGLNILLDIWFVLGLGLGVEGVAIATAIAEVSGAVLGLWFCRAAFRAPGWRDPARILDRAALTRMAAVNRDIFLRSLLLQAAFVSFLFLGARWGDVTLAANQVLLQFLHVTAYALDGFAFAAEALVGQALGARQRDALRRSAILTGGWAVGISAGLAVCFGLFGGLLIDVMTTAPDVRAAARAHLGWMVLTPLVGVWSWMLDGIFIGATRARDMRNMMALSFVGYVAAVLVLAPRFGNDGLWAAILVFFALRAATLALRYPSLEASASA